jgi:hypothetical protein
MPLMKLALIVSKAAIVTTAAVPAINALAITLLFVGPDRALL